MSLPPLSLDDLTFEDLRLLAVRRIPAASAGCWVHHEPVDPGITLLELFAFLLDQQVFMLDQLSDPLQRALLGLLGEAPRGAQCARTVLAPELGRQPGFALIQQGTPLQPRDAGLAHLVFSPRDDALVAPVSEIAVSTGGTEHRLPLSGPIQVLSGAGAPAGFAITVRLAAPFAAGQVGQPLAIALVLDDDAVPPEWSLQAADAPPPAAWKLALSVAGSDQELADWHDGTGGLRRSGLLRFAVPPQLVGQDNFALRLACQMAQHVAPVRLASVACGAVIAEHRWQRRFGPVATGDADHDSVLAALAAQLAELLPNSGQSLQLPDGLGPVLPEGAVLELEHDREGWQAWTAVSDLFASVAEDRHFTLDRELGVLAFGDGFQGRVPTKATALALTASFGGGTAGNHASGLQWEDHARSGNVALVSLVAAEGGEEAETLDEARQRAAAGLLVRQRAVTIDDYVTLVENSPGIAPHRAFVAPGLDPSFPCLRIDDSLTVFVIPQTGADILAPSADDGALELIRARLDTARLLTTRVFVRRPKLRPVALALKLSGDDPGAGGRYREKLEPVLRRYLHPTLGGPGGTGWAPGQALRPSELLRVAQAELGPGWRVEKLAIALTDSDAAASDCAEVAIGAHELVRLETLSVRIVAAQAAEAVL